ncbi:MAG: hypothetical protein MSC45_04415 [Mobiluncus sp.]|uniref:Uncharacterized protein n=1 Tax=Mobiluncus porci TaxID=2652278 RepID=A0A7K0K1N4_9ACTO|nr:MULTISPECIES: hypothetical protein [Mobiluncus]MCI6584299.1 hypothetical protein [Mobiluncus sp.]MST49328.1 hypothetical protein [Mobiluncus porci]
MSNLPPEIQYLQRYYTFTRNISPVLPGTFHRFYPELFTSLWVSVEEKTGQEKIGGERVEIYLDIE